MTKFYKPVETTLKKNKNRLKFKVELVKKTESKTNPDSECVVTFFSVERRIDKLKRKSVLVLKRSNKVK